MKTDIKGFIVTYYNSSDEDYNILIDTITKLSKENLYLVLASHSPVNKDVQEMCDYYIYQQLNIVDDRKYSHGVAESNLIELSLNHLKVMGIDWCWKTSYDIEITNIQRFHDWINDYKYKFVTCKWGDRLVSSNSFFCNIDFMLENITFYKNIEDMFVVNNVLEYCWENDIISKGLINDIFVYNDKYEFFEDNKIDILAYNYNNIDFIFDPNEDKFYVTNNSYDIDKIHLRIFDYYTDLCIYQSEEFSLQKGITWWIVPPCSNNMSKAKNGFYLEIYKDDLTIRKNILVQNFNSKHPLSKKFKSFKKEEVKFNEFCDFDEFSMYKNFNIDLDSINTFVDVGANYGMLSTPFLIRNKKVYLVDADSYNIKLLTNNFKINKNVSVIDKAIYSYDGEIEFWEQPGISVVSSIDYTSVIGTSDRIKKVINCITPNTLLKEYVKEDTIDLFKIDIEGAEYEVFKSFDEESMSKIKRFLIEFHLNDDYRVMEIIEKLALNGFKYKFDKWNKLDDSDFIPQNKMGVIYAWK